MPRRKLARFEENNERENVIQAPKPLFFEIKGKWNERFFKNDNPIVLELACGRGEYSIGLAQQFPDKNFVGIDLKGDRLWQGSSKALELNLTNVAFLRTPILNLPDFFAENEVAEIWIIHPDPRPKQRDEKRRLTSPRYLAIYSQVVKKPATIRLKTDSTSLYEYTMEVLSTQANIQNLLHTSDLYQSDLMAEHYGIQTRYERMFEQKGEKIKYVKFEIC
jgi:tRNA (guanine-N7-)-methyltransferase